MGNAVNRFLSPNPPVRVALLALSTSDGSPGLMIARASLEPAFAVLGAYENRQGNTGGQAGASRQCHPERPNIAQKEG
jgi:hypothetical protein